MKLVAMCVCAALVTGAIDDAGARAMYGGVKGGVNKADVVGDDADDLDRKNGFIGGAFFGVDFTDDFGMRVDGLYVQKGAEGRFTASGDSVASDVTLSLDYLEFPVLFLVGFPTGEKWAVNLFAGPTFGFNLSAQVDVEGEGTSDIENAQTFEFGATFGGGVEYKLESMSLIGDFRYALGATSISDDFDGKNTGVAFMFGVKFPLGER